MEKLWPLAKGSLAERRNKCVNPECKLCKSGKKHISHALYYMKNGRKTSMHIPRDLVDEVKTAMENGRRLESLLSEAGERFFKALKHEKEKG